MTVEQTYVLLCDLFSADGKRQRRIWSRMIRAGNDHLATLRAMDIQKGLDRSLKLELFWRKDRDKMHAIWSGFGSVKS